MKKLIHQIDAYLEEGLLVASLAVSVVIIFTQVVLRYVFGNSLSWSEELAKYMFIWQAWLAVSFATKRSRHICLDMLVHALSLKGKTLFFWIAHLIWLSFTVFIIVKSYSLTATIFRRETVSAAMEIPMGWVYLAVPVGSSLMAFRLLQIMYAKLFHHQDNKP